MQRQRNPEPRQHKRMRLGTKSCSECRRRKVRCTFAAGHDKCQPCVLHGTVCRSQDDSTVTSLPIHTLDSRASSSEDFNSRLGAIEESLRLLCQSLGRSPIDGQNAVGHAMLRANSSEVSTVGRDLDDDEAQDVTTDGYTPLEEAPLVHYLRGSQVAQPASLTRHHPERSGNPLLKNNLLRLIPDNSTLLHIFQYTHRFWAVWPFTASPTNTAQDGHHLPTTVPSAFDFLGESLASYSPSIVAKFLMWLSLCLLQLPKDFEKTTSSRLPLGKIKLIDSYIEEADGLIFQGTSSHTGYDVDILEVYLLQSELYVNLGRPCKAWRSLSAGINCAIMLGLHLPGVQSPRKREIWTVFWHQDRYLSLFLGLPCRIPEHLLPNMEHDDSDLLPEQRVLRRLALICGRIVDRDQHQQQQKQKEAPYSTTVRIMESMDQLKEMIPSAWSTNGPAESPPIPFARSFWRRAVPLFYHYINNFLHLPFINMATRDKKYEYSRTLALESAEDMIRSYQHLRSLSETSFSCDFLDFVAFSAGVILAADMISRDSSRSPNDRERVWALIDGLTRRMRRTAEALNCSVAAQSAEVLGHLYTSRHNTYDGPEHFEANIPYFGRLQIKHTRNGSSDNPGPGVPAPQLAMTLAQQLPSTIDYPQTSVEFDTDAFNFRFPFEFQTVDELAEDWAVGLDFGTMHNCQGCS